MALDITKQINLGACSVSIGGTDVGLTSEKGVKLIPKNVYVRGSAGKYGKGTTNIWTNGANPEIEFELIQTDLSASGLVLALPDATRVSGSGKEKLTFGHIAGTKLTPVELIFTPFQTTLTPDYDLTVPSAVPVGEWTLTYTGDGFQAWTCKFEVLVNEAGGSDGNYYFSFGDNSATAETVAPTVSSYLPVQGEGAAALDTTITATISEALNGNTVNTTSVLLIQDYATTPVPITGTVVLTNSGAATTIVFTPSANLTATKPFIFILDGNIITDLNGNHLATGNITFTTLTP